ncbi:MAG: dTMP kinase [Dehalococcoidia bacterium]|nr:dTMP kinase [Dehalococcoidia bacterium]MCB9484798.1 dTMP kinase [Thermoflexaceae bacterium]
MTVRGIFLALEGGEGAGKSTLASALAARVNAEGREPVLTREPGGTPAGEIVRTLLHEDLVPWAETFAFLAARAQIVAEVIRPALQRGAVVICDRFEASTFAYQGYARGLDLATLRNINRLATGGLSPSLTLLLDIDPAAGLQRKHGEDEAIRTGLESIAFHKKVRSGYFAMAADAAPGGWLMLDARRSPESVAADAWSALELLLRET